MSFSPNAGIEYLAFPFTYPQAPLTDKEIRQALVDKTITCTFPLEDKQLQPNTLDVRLGRTEIFAGGNTPSQIYEGGKNEPIILPAGMTCGELHILDKIETNLEYLIDLRSSRGRQLLRVLQTATTQDGYLQIKNNNPNDIRLYGHDRFAQYQFFENNDFSQDSASKVVTDPDEVRALVDLINPELKTCGPYVLFSVGEEILRYKRIDGGIIDSRQKYDSDELFTKHQTPYTATQNDPIIVQLAEKVSMPDNIGIQLQHNIPLAQESGQTRPSKRHIFTSPHRACAGWVDSGYVGKLTAHPHFYKPFPVSLIKGESFIAGLIYKFSQDSENSYGSEKLGSHYQGSSGGGTQL